MAKVWWLEIFNTSVEEISKQKEILDIILYSAIAFLVPFFFNRPLALVFLITNTVIVLAALNLKGAKWVPVILLPAIGSLLGAFTFGDSSFVIASFIPLLWLGNALLVVLIKFVYLHRKINFFAALFIASTVRYLLIVLGAYFFINLGLAPEVFLLSFGKMQLLTAFIGGIIAFAIIKLKMKK